MPLVDRTARLRAIVLGVATALAGCQTAAGFGASSTATFRSNAATTPEPRGCSEVEPCGGTGDALPGSLMGLAVVVGVIVAHQFWPRS